MALESKRWLNCVSAPANIGRTRCRSAYPVVTGLLSSLLREVRRFRTSIRQSTPFADSAVSEALMREHIGVSLGCR